ncbi:MAG: hypothetical protein RLW61_04575 [Gammaproteobacteria bacterium]
MSRAPSVQDRDEAATPAHLVAAFLRLAGPSPTAAVRAINAELGARYTLTRFNEWRRGDRPTPPAVQRVMRRAVLEDELGETAARRLAALLEPPRP